MITNEKGNFSFSKLRPGEWQIQVHCDRLPQHHAISPNELSFELKPNEEKKLLFDARPIAPKILPLSKH